MAALMRLSGPWSRCRSLEMKQSQVETRDEKPRGQAQMCCQRQKMEVEHVRHASSASRRPKQFPIRCSLESGGQPTWGLTRESNHSYIATLHILHKAQSPPAEWP